MNGGVISAMNLEIRNNKKGNLGICIMALA